MTAAFLHGGGDDPTVRSIAFGRFAQAYLTNVRGPLLLVSTGATRQEAEATADYYRELFAALQVPDNWLIPLPVDPDHPLTGGQVSAHNPSGLFVCGGSNTLYHRALCSDLTWVDYLREHAVPYGGTSAGAVIAADRAILGGWQTADDLNPRQILHPGASEGVERLLVRPGAGLVPFAVDVHAGQMGTLTRLIHAIHSGLVDEGWAIDEDTLMAVHPTRIQIYGRGHAYRVVRAAEGRVTVRILTAPVTFRRR